MVDMRVASAKKRREARTSGGSSSSSKSSSSGNKSTSTSKSTVPKFTSFAKQPLPQSKAVPDFASFGKKPLPQSQAPTSQRPQSRNISNSISAASNTPTGSSKLEQFGQKVKTAAKGFGSDVDRYLNSDQSDDYKIAEIKAQQFGYGTLTQKEKDDLSVRFNMELPVFGVSNSMLKQARRTKGLSQAAKTIEAAALRRSTILRRGVETKLKQGSLEAMKPTIGKPAAEFLNKGIGGVTSLNNPKAMTLTKKLLIAAGVSSSALAIAGAAAGNMFFGNWGNTEAPEPLGFTRSKTLIPYALETGDWSYVDESFAAEDELQDMTDFQKFLLKTPLAPFVGTAQKMKGIKLERDIQKRVVEDLKIMKENEESPEDFHARLREQELEEDAEDIRLYNEARDLQVARERETKLRQQEIDNTTFDDNLKRQRQEKADFWTEYYKEIDAATTKKPKYQSTDYTQSNLKFGLL